MAYALSVTRFVSVLALVLLTACTSQEPTTPPTTTTTTVDAPDLERLRQVAGTPGRAEQILGAEVVGGTLEIRTSLFRDAESGPAGLGICITAQEAGAEGPIQVLGTDGGVIASTRPDLTGNDAGNLCGIRVE